MSFAVLVTRHVYEAALDLLRPVASITYHDSREGMSHAALCAAVADKDAVLCQLTDGIDAAVLAAGERLKIVANIAVGYDNIDVAAARGRGILVTNTPGVLTESTADLTFALILGVARRLGEAERFLRDLRWRSWEIDLLCGVDVHGRTLGIVGMGRIGQAVARRARGFGMRVLYASRSRLSAARETELGVEFVTLEALLPAADFVSLHVPLRPETKNLIGAPELAAMRPDACLINTARGGVVDEDALITALRERRLAGAGLDVFAAEPDFDRRFLDVPGVLLLPHIGSATSATRSRMCTLAAQAIVAVAEGRAPEHVVR